jgi:hypothetical protein
MSKRLQGEQESYVIKRIPRAGEAGYQGAVAANAVPRQNPLTRTRREAEQHRELT